MRTRLLFIAAAIMLSACSPKGDQTNANANTAKQNEPKTKLEAFIAKTGTVVIRGFSEIGSLQGLYGSSVAVDSMEFTDVTGGKNEKAYGMTIQVKETQRLERDNKSYIDYDEIESLIRGIEYIGKVDKSVTKLSNFQADFRTRGQLRISTFNESTSKETFVSVSSGEISGTTAYFKLQELGKFKDLIVEAKKRLDAVRQAA